MEHSDFRYTYLPYCLKKQKDGNYAVLNRNYKPLGFITRDLIEYEKFPVLSSLPITKTLATKLSYKGDDNLDDIYLYNDGTNPLNSKADMDTYLKRIALLAPLKFTY
ncbi:MAG: hypothetical protein CSB48_02840 [Proteobacteria bacterium]|nr:MAG: hypothetical protein CSB48_02840 [Pseudomonadota bacterium]